MLYSIELRSHLEDPQGILLGKLLILDAGLLTGEIAQVEDTRTADFADLVDLDAVDERGLVGEYPLNTDTCRYFAYSKGPGVRILAADLDDDSPEFLEPLLIAFLDPVGDSDSITCLELGI